MTSKKRRSQDDDAYEPEDDANDDDYTMERGGMEETISRRSRSRNALLELGRSAGGGGGAAASSSGKGKGKGKGKGAASAAAAAAAALGRGGLGDDDDDGELPTFKDFTRAVTLKPDHEKRPIWVCPDGHIFLEAASPIYQAAYDFLVAIAEPVSRPEFVHEYRLTPYSLYAAVAVAITTEDIIAVLNRLSKTDVPDNVREFVESCTAQYGKAKLVLKHNHFYIESPYAEVLRKLLENPVIHAARITEGGANGGSGADGGEGGNGGGGDGEAMAEGFTLTEVPKEMDANTRYRELVTGGDDVDGDDNDADVMLGTAPGHAPQNVSFRIRNESVELVKKAAIEMDFPLMEEYDFRHDSVNPSMKIDLKPHTKIRSYQEKCLSKMFGNGRARSGIIVLPCGAGKTLTGVTAASTIGKSCLVLCTSGVSVLQWKYQFQLWTDIADKKISCFTSDLKEAMDPDCGVLITTYTMISFGGKRSLAAQQIIDRIRSREWGCMLLDEVHVVPAKMFRKVLNVVNAHCKLGLTATLVREDNLINDLNFLIGPKLYEANWMDLTAAGYLANVQCVEAWCPMTAEFFAEYLSEAHTARRRELLYVMNPTKFRTCEFLMRFHQERGDKIILFADNVFALKKYATILGIPFIYGETRDHERQRVLGLFRTGHVINCIGLSKVGDTSIDIPEANVIIQISSHFGSRRQEAQRLGRILRPKASSSDGFNAFFYTLVSTDTSEMFYSAKRQQYLVDQGYTFKVVTDLVEVANAGAGAGGGGGGGKLASKKDELDLLAEVLGAETDKEAEREEAAEDAAIGKAVGDDDVGEGAVARRGGGGFGNGAAKVRRKQGNMSELSGAGGTRYIEYNTGGSGKAPGLKHVLFRRRYLQVAK